MSWNYYEARQKARCHMILIELKNISKEIKRIEVLKNINISFESGTIYGLKGKNGSGKTMLMRMISGLIIPTRGEVIINGEVLHKDISFPKSIGVLIENPAFLPDYTGLDNLKVLADLSNISISDVLAAIVKCGLNPDDKRTFKKYSLGMKQKLGIANAIMGEPDIIILDEPINALDEESVEKIKEELIRLRDLGKLIILACHDREELEYLSDEIIEIRDGEIINR